MSMTLAACGGGGDSTSSNNNGGGGTTTTNNSPTISISESSISLDENTSSTLTIATSDADGDTVTVSVSENSAAFDASLSGNTLTITANDVDADATGTITLSASDGKGGTASTTVSVTVNDVPDSNNGSAPTVAFDNGYAPLDEQGSYRIAISLSDPDDDIVSVEASTESTLLTVSYDEQTQEVIIDTGAVSETISNQMVHVLVTDAIGNTGDTELNVTIVDVPVQNAAPSITINTDSGVADYTVIDRTQLVVPFTASDTETANASLTYTVEITDLDPLQNFPYEFTYEVDVDNQLAIIQMPASELDSHDFSATVTVTDEGNKTATADLTFTIRKSPQVSEVTFEAVPNLMFETQTYTIGYRINALDIEHYNLVRVDYYNDADRTENLLDFTLDEAAQTVTITPKSGAAGKNIRLVYEFTFREDGLTSIGFIDVNAASAWNASQIALSEKVEELRRHLSQSMEMELAAEFMLEALLLNGTISQQVYESRLDALAKLEGRVMNVEVAQGNYNNYVATLQASEYYRDAATAQNAINLIDGLIRGLETTAVYVIDVVNQYSTELGMGNVLVSDNAEYTLNTTERVSRFVGNTNYGSYSGETWVFKPEFKWLDAVVRQAYSNSL